MEKISFYVNKELNSTIFTIEKDAVYANMRDGIEEFYRGEFTKYMLLDFSNHEKPLSSEEIMLTGQQMMRLGKLRKGGFDLIAQGMCGLMSTTGEEGQDPRAVEPVSLEGGKTLGAAGPEPGKHASNGDQDRRQRRDPASAPEGSSVKRHQSGSVYTSGRSTPTKRRLRYVSP